MDIFPINQVVPEHVPVELVRDFDVNNYAKSGSDFFEALFELKQSSPPVFWTRHNGGHWMITDAALAIHIGRSPELFSSRMTVVPKSLNPPGRGLNPVHLDPPEHTKYRQLLSLALSRKSVAELTPSVRNLAVELIEDLRVKGKCEFMADFAFKLPVIVFLRLVDLPVESRIDLLDLVSALIHPGSDKTALVRNMANYLAPFVRDRYMHPKADLISWLGQREVDGARMPEDELLSICTLLLIGGLDTVANTLGFFARFFAEYPEYRKQIRENPSLVAGAVEELLRRFPTVTSVAGRLCVADTVLGDVNIKAGDMVMSPPAMQNFDDILYPDPLVVDFTRRVNNVGTFGQGPHRCAGANLARSELAIFIQEWIARIPEFYVAGGEPPVFQPGFNISYSHLNLEWPI